jgi:hypothetical protein
MNENASRPISVDLTAKNVATTRHLGAAADMLLRESVSRSLLVSFGANASRQEVTLTFARWLVRNDRLIRSRVNALAVVTPSLWVRIQWRLYFLLCQPVVRTTVHGTESEALRWLTGREDTRNTPKTAIR